MVKARLTFSLAAVLCAGAGLAEVTAPPVDASAAQAQIPFANHHGIYDWRVINDRTVLIQSQTRQWYKATLMSACFDLPFAERIGFESNPDGSFDKFSAITVRDQRCPLISLVAAPAPGKKGAAPAAAAPPAASAATAPSR